MTARQVFEATLIELSKVLAPALKLYEFNYLFNKAINLYINKVYNVYDLNQQTTDDLRVLKSTAYLTPKKWNDKNSALHNSVSQASSYLSQAHRSIQSMHGATYEVAMPIDYLHLLNCVCIYYVAKQKDCWDAGSYIEIPATRLTADSWSQIVTDIYNRPSPMKPYYYIHNQNNQTNNELLPTDPIMGLSSTGLPNGTDMTGTYHVISNGLPITFVLNATVASDKSINLVLKEHQDRRLTATLPKDADTKKAIAYKWSGTSGEVSFEHDDVLTCLATIQEHTNAGTPGQSAQERKITCTITYTKIGETASTTDTSNTWIYKVYATLGDLQNAMTASGTTSNGMEAFTNIQGLWYKVVGLEYVNGAVKRADDSLATSLNPTSIAETISCVDTADTELLDQLLYNTNGKNVTAMFYPNPGETLGWAEKTGDEVSIYTDNVAKAAADLASVTCEDPNYRSYLNEYVIAKALLDNASTGYSLRNVNADESGVASSNFPRTFKFDMNGDGIPDTNVSLVEKPTAIRTGNVSNVRMEIRYGKLRFLTFS